MAGPGEAGLGSLVFYNIPLSSKVIVKLFQKIIHISFLITSFANNINAIGKKPGTISAKNIAVFCCCTTLKICGRHHVSEKNKI